MNERDQVALVARDALSAGDPTTAIAHWRRLVHDDPAHPVWRLRLADAHAAAGEGTSAWMLREELAEGALASGRTLHALVAALAAGDDGLAARFAPHLARATSTRPPTPPGDGARPLGDVAPDAPPPPYPVVAGAPTPLPLLSLLDGEAFARVAPSLSRRALAAGDVLLAEGDHADAVYLVAAGTLQVLRSDDAVGEVGLGVVGEGALLGEMALVLERPRSATVRALTEAELVRIDLAALKAAAEAPAVARALGEHTRRRLLQTLLATSPLFRDVDPDARAAILRRFAVRDVPEGFVLVEQGDPAGRLALIAEGSVEVFRAEGDEPGSLVATLGPGDAFGEIALLTGQPATATVVALSDSTLLELDAAGLDDVCRAHPEVGERLEALSADRLAENRFIFADDEFFETPD